MANIGFLDIGIRANADKALREFKRTTDGVARMRSGIASATVGFGKLAAGVAAFAGIGLTAKKMMDELAESFERLDTLGKTADKLGLSSENLAGLRFAAEQTGVAVTSLDTGLQRMVRRIAEAAQGTGEARNALLELGVNARQIANLPADKQFHAIADAMDRVKRQSDRVRLGFKLFDTEGVALVNTLRGGSAALEDFQAQAVALGIAVDRDTIRGIEQTNDAVNRLNKAWEGLFNTAATQSAPYLKLMAESTTALIKKPAISLDPDIAELEAKFFFARLNPTNTHGDMPIFKSIRAEIANRKFLKERVAEMRKVQAAQAEAAEAAARASHAAANDFVRSLIAGVRDWGSEIAATAEREMKRFEPIAKVFEDLQMQIDRTMFTEAELLQRQLKNMEATTAEMRRASLLFDQLQDKQSEINLFKRTKEVLDELLGPGERLARFIRELNELGERITAKQRDALISKRFDDLFGGQLPATPQSPAALQRGTVEARSAELSAINRLLGVNDRDQFRTKALKEAEKASKELDLIERHLQEIKTRSGIVIVNS